MAKLIVNPTIVKSSGNMQKIIREHIGLLNTNNDEIIKKGCSWADVTIAAWGNHGAHLKRGEKVKILLYDLQDPKGVQ